MPPIRLAPVGPEITPEMLPPPPPNGGLLAGAPGTGDWAAKPLPRDVAARVRLAGFGAQDVIPGTSPLSTPEAVRRDFPGKVRMDGGLWVTPSPAVAAPPRVLSPFAL